MEIYVEEQRYVRPICHSRNELRYFYGLGVSGAPLDGTSIHFYHLLKKR